MIIENLINGIPVLYSAKAEKNFFHQDMLLS